MTFETGMKMHALEKELRARFPYEELEYRNSVVAKKIAIGKGDQLTEDWVRRALLADVEDGFMTYGQAVAIKDQYMKAIEELR